MVFVAEERHRDLMHGPLRRARHGEKADVGVERRRVRTDLGRPFRVRFPVNDLQIPEVEKTVGGERLDEAGRKDRDVDRAGGERSEDVREGVVQKAHLGEELLRVVTLPLDLTLGRQPTVDGVGHGGRRPKSTKAFEVARRTSPGSHEHRTDGFFGRGMNEFAAGGDPEGVRPGFGLELRGEPRGSEEEVRPVRGQRAGSLCGRDRHGAQPMVGERVLQVFDRLPQRHGVIGVERGVEDPDGEGFRCARRRRAETQEHAKAESKHARETACGLEDVRRSKHAGWG